MSAWSSGAGPSSRASTSGTLALFLQHVSFPKVWDSKLLSQGYARAFRPTQHIFIKRVCRTDLQHIHWPYAVKPAIGS